MVQASTVFGQISDLYYGQGDDDAGIKALGINMTDVEEDESWLKGRAEDDDPIRAEIINIILRSADAIGARVILIDWSGVTMGGKYFIRHLDVDKISVLVQNQYHIKHSAVHMRCHGAGDDAVRKSQIANTTRIAALSLALTKFGVTYGYPCEVTLLQALSIFKFVRPELLRQRTLDEFFTPSQVYQGEDATADEVQVNESELTPMSDGKVENEIADIVIEAVQHPTKQSTSASSFPCLVECAKGGITNEQVSLSMMKSLGVDCLDDGLIVSLVPEYSRLYFTRFDEVWSLPSWGHSRKSTATAMFRGVRDSLETGCKIKGGERASYRRTALIASMPSALTGRRQPI